MGDATKKRHRIVISPYLHVALYQPEIPWNTGNIARLCGAAEMRLHLIHPLGFRMDDRHLKRAGLDYLSLEDFLDHVDDGGQILGFSRHASQIYTKAEIHRGDYLLFGQETRGLPSRILESFPSYTIPVWGNVRSLNLSTAVGIVVYHFLHRLGKF